MPRTRLDLVGVSKGRLLVEAYLGNSLWRCVCTCGNKITAYSGNLKSGNTKSCGCLLAESRCRPKSDAFRLARSEDVKNGVSGYKLSKKAKFKDKHGRIFSMRSTWEVKFAEFLDKTGILWDYEPFAIPLMDGRYYLPDFIERGTKIIHEVKGREDAESASKTIIARAMGWTVHVHNRRSLKSLGIDLNSVVNPQEVKLEDALSAFMARVVKLCEGNMFAGTHCWIWSPGIKSKSVFLRFNGLQEYAHRYSYKVFNGQIPTGMIVYRACGVVKCVNPKHLQVGTQADVIRTTEIYGKGNHRNGSMV